MEKKHSGYGSVGRWLGRFLEGVFVITAGTLIGGGLLGVFGLTLLHRALIEQMLVGGTIGALWGVLRITRFRYALSFGMGALVGGELGIWRGDWLHNALWLAPLCGGIGILVQRVFFGVQPATESQTISIKTRLLAIFSALAGMIVGGFSSTLVSAWLCMIIMFGVWPWQRNQSINEAGVLIPLVGFLGGIVGAVFGARWLYLWVLRRAAVRPDGKQTIRDYEQWKQQHQQTTEQEKPAASEEDTGNRS